MPMVVPLSSLMDLYFGHVISVYAATGTVPPMIFSVAPRSTALIAADGSTIATLTWPAISAWIKVSVEPIKTTSP